MSGSLVGDILRDDVPVVVVYMCSVTADTSSFYRFSVVDIYHYSFIEQYIYTLVNRKNATQILGIKPVGKVYTLASWP